MLSPEAVLRPCPGYGLAGTMTWRGDVFPGGGATPLSGLRAGGYDDLAR
ncbi:hypothetical protein [Raoultella sp. BIGb0399]|nr:hypothetical protein [Raoultella sp. BIGb0399]